MSKKSKSATTSIAALQSRFQQASALHQQGFLAQAESLYNEILQANAKHVDALHYMGILAAQTQRPELGVQLIEQAIAINPHHHALYSNLGNSLLMLSRFEDAARAYAKAIALKPTFAEAHCNRGNALKALQRHDEAAACYAKALALNPQLADAHGNWGAMLTALEQHAQALVHLDKALKLRPAYPEAWANMGISLQATGQSEQALQALAQALALNPGSVDALLQQGHILRNFGLLDESQQSFEKALQLQPGHADAWNDLGVTFYEMGQLPQALRCYRQALAANPQHLHAHTNVLFTLSISPQTTPADYLAQAQAYSQLLSTMAQPYADWLTPEVATGQPLRIGLVSGDLNHHPVGFFLEGLLSHLDTSQIELTAYVTHGKADALTARIKPFFKAWVPVSHLSPQAAASKIRNDGMHILIDLAGHTGENMLALFAWRPAPVQVSWLGYFASTGVPTMDWVLADAASVPEGNELHFTEQVMRLPHTRLCFTPMHDAPPVAPLPALTRGHITFGSFQPLPKLTDDTLSLWAQVLQQVPTARLRLQNRAMTHAPTRAKLMERLQQAGVDVSRTDLCNPCDYTAYLQAHAEVDVLLDTFPFPGGTTTCEALWMGVPTLTLAGQTMLSRQGASILQACGLSNWVAPDRQTYVALAASKTHDLPALASLRAGLRAQVAASPMFDTAQFARHWQAAMLQLKSPAAARKSS